MREGIATALFTPPPIEHTMPKPIVIFTSDEAQKTLRESAMFPQTVFRDCNDDEPLSDENILYLWPHEIDYEKAAGKDGQISDTGHISGFFGMKKPNPGYAEDAATAAVVKYCLDTVAVHIVFFDANERRPFSKIKTWGENCINEIVKRYGADYPVQQMEHVLVLVARGDTRIEMTKDETVALRESLGANTFFKTCYFHDINLSIGKTREHLPTVYIWEAMVGRLLMAFLFTQNGNTPIWKRPGTIKVWGAWEFTATVPENEFRESMKKALDKAYVKIEEKASERRKEPIYLSITTPPHKSGINLNPPKSNRPVDGERNCWHRFNGVGFAGKINTHWSGEGGSAKFGECPVTSLNFQSTVHRSPSDLEAMEKKLEEEIAAGRKTNEKDSPVEKMNDIEAERRALLDKLRISATEYDKATAHYVTRGVAAAIVFFAITLPVGLIIWRIVHFFGASVGYASALVFCVAFGAVLAASLIKYGHWLMGGKAKTQLVRLGDQADEKMMERFGAAVAVMRNAEENRTRLRSVYVWSSALSLVRRAREMIRTELKPATALMENAGNINANSQSEKPEKESPKNGYMRRLYSLVKNEWNAGQNDKSQKPGISGNTDWVVEELVGEWFGKEGNKMELKWKAFCAEHDTVGAGHFPALKLLPMMKAVVSLFIMDLRKKINRASVENLEAAAGACFPAEFETWAGKRAKNNRYCFSAATDGTGAERESWFFVTDALKTATLEKAQKAFHRYGRNGRFWQPGPNPAAFDRIGFYFSQITTGLTVSPDGHLVTEHPDVPNEQGEKDELDLEEEQDVKND